MFFRPQFLVGNQVVGNGLYFGLSLGDIIYYTTPGADTFDYPDYPGLRAVLVECQGGGGQGGGAPATGAGQLGAGGGGSGGVYARSLVLVSNLDTTEAITVGAGGTGAAAGATGNAGDDSVFDTISGEVRGKGGNGGGVGGPTTGPTLVGSPADVPSGSVGDFIVLGDDGDFGTGLNTVRGGRGGGSFFGGQQRPANSTSTDGAGASPWGGGGAGASNGASQPARTGGAGSQGIVIVSLFY